MLTRVKDWLWEGKCSKVFYWIPCDCGNIGGTICWLETRLKEHKKTTHRKADMEMSGVVEHSWNTQLDKPSSGERQASLTSQGAEDKGGPTNPYDTLSPAPQPKWGTGADELLDGDDETDRRQVKLHPWSQLQDACILIAWCYLSIFASACFTLALKTSKVEQCHPLVHK